MNCYSKAIATGLLLLSFGNLLAQSPQPKDSRESLPAYLQSLIKPNEQDDEIRKLERQRLESALLGMEILRLKYERGLVPISFLVDFQKLAGVAAIELAATKELKIKCLEYILEASRTVEFRVLELQKVGARGGQAEDAAQAKYWRLEAEINLLKFKRDSVLEK